MLLCFRTIVFNELVYTHPYKKFEALNNFQINLKVCGAFLAESDRISGNFIPHHLARHKHETHPL